MTERAQNADFRRKPQIFADSPPWSSLPCFFGIPCFFCCKEFPCFFVRFSVFFWDFGRERKSLLFWVVFLAFPKEDQGPGEIQVFGGRRKPQKTRRFSQKTEDFSRKPQIGLRHPRSVAIFDPFWGHFSCFSASFPHFPSGVPKPIFFPFRARGPKWGLYQAIRITILAVQRNSKL